MSKEIDDIKAAMREVITPPFGTSMPPVISEKTMFTWPVVSALIAIAVVAVVAIAEAKDAASTTRVNATQIQSHELRLQRVEDAQTNTAELLRELKSELREANRKLDELAQQQRRKGTPP